MGKFAALFRQHIVDKIHCRVNGSPKNYYWRELEKKQFLSAKKLREIQWQRLKHILDFAWEYNEFYRKRFLLAGLVPNAIHSPEDLQGLPVLTKTDIRKSAFEMISQGFPLESLHKIKTGGSTGKALELYLTEECSELRNACARRHDRWTGWEPGEPIAACWGNPHLPKTFKEKLKQRLLQPMLYLDTMCINETSIKTFIDQWRRVKPTLLYGHAHSIFLLAQYLKELGVVCLRPKGVLSTSMMLIPSERKLIEEVFGCKVIDRYGCEEVSLIGCECENHEGMHLNIEHLFIEFIREDGTPAAIGEPGNIVVTDLLNKAMPLVRYNVEDVGVPTDRTCSCGRGLPLMESVAGRVADFLIKKDGTKVAGISLIENTLTQFPGLDQMQIVQQSYEKFEIYIVAGDSYDDKIKQACCDYFKTVFGRNLQIEIIPVESIRPETSGKYRFSICNIV